MTTIAVMEGLGYACRDMGLIFSMNAHMWTNSIPPLLYGTEETKRKYLPGLCDGSLIGANGASEPDSGSDVFALRTRCVRDGDHFVLNGTKMFVTNAQVADLIAVYATLDPELGVMGICGFIVEMGMVPKVATYKLLPYGPDLIEWFYARIAEQCRERGIRLFVLAYARPGGPIANEADALQQIELASSAGFTVLDMRGGLRWR